MSCHISPGAEQITATIKLIPCNLQIGLKLGDTNTFSSVNLKLLRKQQNEF